MRDACIARNVVASGLVNRLTLCGGFGLNKEVKVC